MIDWNSQRVHWIEVTVSAVGTGAIDAVVEHFLQNPAPHFDWKTTLGWAVMGGAIALGNRMRGVALGAAVMAGKPVAPADEVTKP